MATKGLFEANKEDNKISVYAGINTSPNGYKEEFIVQGGGYN